MMLMVFERTKTMELAATVAEKIKSKTHRSEKIHRLNVSVELYSDGQGFFHIVYKAEGYQGGYVSQSLRKPTRNQFKAASMYEDELELLNTPHFLH